MVVGIEWPTRPFCLFCPCLHKCGAYPSPSQAIFLHRLLFPGGPSSSLASPWLCLSQALPAWEQVSAVSRSWPCCNFTWKPKSLSLFGADIAMWNQNIHIRQWVHDAWSYCLMYLALQSTIKVGLFALFRLLLCLPQGLYLYASMVCS